MFEFAASGCFVRCPRNLVPLLGVVLLFSACQGDDGAEKAEIRPVRVMATDTRMSGDTVSLVGTVQPESEINLSFRISGRLVERAVAVGDNVRRGQLVARLETQDEESGLQSARAQLSAARAQQVEADNHFGRMRGLVAQNAVSRALFDQADANRKSARSQVESAQAQFDLANNRLGYTRLVSDVAGVVTAHGAEPGEVVSAGRMIVQVAREGGRDAAFDVPARVKDNAPENAEITVVLTSDPSVTAVGRVREVAPRADPVTGTFRVKVGLVDPPAAMRLGSTVTGRLALDAVAGIQVPASAVIRANQQAAVWVVDPKTGEVSMRPIEIQSSDPDNVVIASGLEPGDVVVTAGAQALRPGQKVRLLESAQ
ncbi:MULTISPECIES: efflux RND transporter periplasmic adaptor subunit [unclassified Luteimonas]